MPSLILLKAPGGAAHGLEYPLAGGPEFFLGRDADQCQVVIPNGSVSRRHAVITAAAGQFLIEDLESRNGTFVNHARTHGPVPLRSEDRIKICDFLFRFYDEAAPADNRTAGPDPDPDDDGPEVVRSTVNLTGAREFLEVAPSDRLRALLDISTGLSRTLELDPLLPHIADSLFKVFRQADRCFLIMLDESGRLVTKYARSQRPTASGDAPQFSRTIVRRCLASLQSYLSEDASADGELSSAHSVSEFRIRSVMCVPLAAADGTPLGAIQLDAQDLAKKFKEDDLKLLTIVANIASVSIEKAQAHAELLTREKERGEIEIARKVQAGFLPNVFPQCAGYEFYAYYSPAQSVGGDFYDFITLPAGRIAVVLGDVAGKGVAAALLMAKLSAEVRFAFLTEPDVAKAVTLLSDQLIQGGIGDRFVTLAAAVLDPATHCVTLVNAGHINPARLTPAGTYGEVLSDAQSGVPLGLVPGYPYEATVIELGLNESLLLYTDGVPDAEAPSDARFGCAGVADAVERAVAAAPGRPVRAPALGVKLVRAVQAHAAGRPQSDDIALVCFGRTDGAAPPPTETGLKAVPDAVTARIPSPLPRRGDES